MDEQILDCLIIGGGPAGLTAAIYLARFHLDILVVDGGKSRASWIPCTRNVSGFPDGIGGTALLQRMRDQTRKYGAKVESEFVTKLERDETTGLFMATWGSGRRTARTVLLATGVTNRRPLMDEELHDEALARGLIRYCPICDGYEVTDKKVGVIGSDSHGVAEALFLRGFTAEVTLIAPDEALRLKPEDNQQLNDAGIERVDGPAHAVAFADDCITVDTAEGHYTFDSIYPALGSDIHTQLAEMLGADLSSDCITSTATCAPLCQASTLRETWSSGSTRSATRWARAGLPRRPSATTSRSSDRSGVRRGTRGLRTNSVHPADRQFRA